MTTIAERTGGALAEAAREARSAWRPWYAGVAVLLVVVALVPVAPPAWVHVDSVANGFYLALAATGLWITVGLAGCRRSARAPSWQSARSPLRS